MNALDLLKSDHDTVRAMFEQFRSAHESDDIETMARVCEDVFAELEVHTAIEEEIFYPAVRKAGGEELNETTDESVEEHHVVDLLMTEIRGLQAGDDAYVAKMTVLMENVEHHASEEEDEMFPEVRRLLDEQQLAALGEELAQAKVSQTLASMSKDELYEKAGELGIEGRSSMSKDELARTVAEASS